MNLENAMVLFRQGQEAARFDGCSSEQVLDEYARAQDEAAFRELFRRHAAHVWAVCRRELPDPALAEDAFQMTFLALVRQAKGGKRFGSLAGWLDVAARRTAGKLRRKQTRAGAIAEVTVAAPPDDTHEDKERAEKLRSAVAELPDRYRLPITYRYLAGLSPAEMARAIGVPEDTGKTRLKRGLQMLRERLAGKGLGIGIGATTGSVTLESALRAAAERVPHGVLAATLEAVKALPAKVGMLATFAALVTYQRAVRATLLALGMAGALVSGPGPDNRRLSTATRPVKASPMRVSPLLAVIAAFFGPAAPDAQAQAAYAWGENNWGQLGNGTTTRSSTPVPVTGMTSGVTAVATGPTESLAVQNGALFAWGNNTFGQLGNGTSGTANSSSTPVPVTGMASGVTAVGAAAAFVWRCRTGPCSLGGTTISANSATVRRQIEACQYR